MTSLRSIGVVTALTVGALALAMSVVVPVQATTEPPPTSSTVPPPTVPPFTAGPTTSTTTVVTTPGQTTTTVAPSPAAGELVLPDEPLGPEAMDVVNALYEARVVFVEALMDPDAPGLDERLDYSYADSVAFGNGGNALDIVNQFRAELRAEGIRAYQNESTPWRLSIESIEFFAEPFPNVDVRACYVDSLIAYRPGGRPDGGDDIVSDVITATRLVLTLVPEDDRWQLWHVQEVSDSLRGTETCPAE